MIMNVLLADPDLAVRSAISLLLKHKLGVRSIDEVNDASQLVERMACTHPDLLLIDWEMPGLNVAAMMEQINSRSNKRPSIIMMSVKDENEPSALSSGADAFLNKQAPAEQVLNLLQQHLRE